MEIIWKLKRSKPSIGDYEQQHDIIIIEIRFFFYLNILSIRRYIVKSQTLQIFAIARGKRFLKIMLRTKIFRINVSQPFRLTCTIRV